MTFDLQDAPSGKMPGNRPASESSPAPGATVLIVDDNAANRLLLSSQLQMEGYQIVEAADGKEGVEKALECRPDIILLDVMMPVMNGFEVCAYLKADPELSLTPIIMVTALRDVQYRIKGIQAGADEFLYRPHHREELLVRVRSLIQLKRARQNLEEERNRLQLLYDISQAITTELDLEQMMSNIITYTQNAVAATKGNIMLLDEEGQVTHKILKRAGSQVEVAYNVAQQVMTEGLAGWLVRQNKGYIIDDAGNDPRWVTLPDDDEPAGSVIGVPLSRMDRIVGVLILVHPQPGYFRQEHLTLLEAVGSQITAAIENAYLFADVKEERRKLEALLAQSTDAIITTDEQWRISLVNRAAETCFRLKAEEVTGRDLRQVARLQAILPLFERAVDAAATDEVSIEGGRTLYVSVSPVPEAGFVAVMQDVTEMKRMEEMRLLQERREKQLVKDTFARYMGPSLVEQVLSTEPGLLGMRERRWAVVMFADLRGFTRMIVSLEANMAIMVLNEYFTRMTDVVYEFNGTIFDLAGDELMVGFNIPFDQPDGPYRALRTALSMQQHFDSLRQELYAQVGTELGLGIGIDQGYVVVGNVGAETRMNFAMVGEAVNTAHRLVDLADDGQIVITAGVYQAIERSQPGIGQSVPLSSLGLVSLKGKSRPEMLYMAHITRSPLPAQPPGEEQ